MKVTNSFNKSPGVVFTLSKPFDLASISLILEIICKVFLAEKFLIAVI